MGESFPELCGPTSNPSNFEYVSSAGGSLLAALRILAPTSAAFHEKVGTVKWASGARMMQEGLSGRGMSQQPALAVKYSIPSSRMWNLLLASNVLIRR